MTAFRRALLCMLVVAAVGALVALPVSAFGAGRNSTRVIVSLKLPAFHGRLKSPRSACLGSRTVKMFRKQGRRTVLLGHSRSSNSGRWTVRVGKLRPGAYFAKVAKRGKCMAAKSKVLRIG